MATLRLYSTDTSTASRVGGTRTFIKAPVTYSGVVLTDFIFSLVIFGGMSVVLFALAYSLFVVEVTQYVAYSISRAHLAGNQSAQRQMEVAVDKYRSLLNQEGPIGRIFKNSWFRIEEPQRILVRQGNSGSSSISDFNQEFGNSDSQVRGKFGGVSIRLAFNVLKINLPSLGSTQSEESEDPPTTYINAFMIREPSQRECLNFFQERASNRNLWRGVLSDPEFPIGNSQQFGFLGDDNGC
ncbi:MAG: hypothetical protein NZ480_07630 [Bdellovibrionaceae bacterium]|nr:hypothetical protein [Pseudobdellovibrionaceae bacterium]